MNKRNYFLSFLLIVATFGNLTSQASYCASKGNAPWQEWIANVQFGTINNASQKEGYGNFTSQTTTVAKGTSYPLSILQGFSWAADPTNQTQQGKVWIDYNQNGTFEDTELAASFTRTTVTANITIPTTALTGATRMRVSLKTIGAPTACEVFEKGEVEDYSVNITGGGIVPPDFVITDVVAPSSVRINEKLTYSFRVKNIGGATTNTNVIVDAKLESTSNISAFAGVSILLRGVIPTGFDSLITFNDNIRPNSDAGNYNLVFTADLLNNIIESNETNNRISVPITLNGAVTDNRKLKITSVTGPTTGVPNGSLPLSITIKNEGTVPSNEDSVSYVKFSQANFNVGVFDLPYSPTKVAVPPIPAGGSVTIAANFVLPGTLVSVKALLTSKNQAFEPFLILEEQKLRSGPLNTSGTADLATKFFYYPLTPASRADIAVTGRVLSTYTTQNKLLNFELTIKNNGPDRAQNIRIVLDSFTSRNGSFQVKDGLNNLTIVSPQVGITENLRTQNGGLEEDVTQRPTYTLETIDANQTVTVALRATILPKEFFGPGERVTPDTFIISPKIIYVDAVDNNAANNQTSPLIFLKNPNNELTITSCPQNVIVTAALGATSAPATFSEPTGTSTAACGATGGVVALRRSGPFDGNYPIGVTEVVYELNDRCGNSKFCRFTVTVVPQSNNLPDLSSVDGFNDTYFGFVVTKSVITGGRITVKNFGTATVSTPHAVSLYFSTDTILSANDILVGKKSIRKTLAAGDTAIIRSEEFIFPDNIQGGNYYFIIKTDADNAITEFSETNNVKYINAFVSNPNMSAFIFADPTLNQNAPLVRGSQYTLRTDFSFSQGFPRKDKFSLKFYFSKDSTLSADDYIINERQDSFRTSSNQLIIPFNTTLIPATFTSGIYYIIYEIDNENVIFESNERDNKAYIRVNWDNGVTPNANSPDLTLANLTVPTPSVLQGNILNFAFDLKNIATANVKNTTNANGNFNIKSYLSKDQTLSADDYQDGTVPTANLAAGVTIPQVAGAMTVRNTVAAGQYYLILKVDGDDQIVESNENNNVIVSTGLINVTAPSVNNYCASKGTAPWEYWVGNVSLGTINNTSDKFKDFATLGYSDYTNISTTLNKGQSYPLSITPGLSWIGNVPNAYCRVWIDFNQNKTFEANELVLEKNNQNPLTQSVLIPTTALTGNTRMRVALKFGAYPTACETFDKGEVEDYTVNISGATVDPCLTDVTPPVFSNCPTTPIRLTINASVEPLLSINNPLVTDNCGPPTLTAVSAKSTIQIASETVSVYTAVAGSTDTITFAATDAKGNKATCKAVYIIERSGSADIVLSIASTPSVFTKYSVNTIRVTAQNVGNQTFTNVKVELKRPALTSNGGSKMPSIGTFQDFCPGGIECSEWTIPSLAAGATATLDAPFFILDANAPIVVTTKLLSSTPTDANTTNNTATVSVSPAAAGAAASVLALSRPKPTQFMPIVVQSIEPTMTDGNVTVRLESIVEKEVSFNIYNSMGKQIFSEKRKVEKGENLLNFDVSEFAQGMYLIAPESSFARNTPSKFIKF
jgi:subtilase family serine protease